MTKMAKGRARMCSRTYRGRWPSGFSQSTCPLPKVLSYETSRAGNGPGDFPDPAGALALHKHIPSSLASVFGEAKELSLLPQLLSNKQFQLPCVPVEKQRTCHRSADQMAAGSRARRSTWGRQAKPIGKHPWGGQTPAGTTAQWMN